MAPPGAPGVWVLPAYHVTVGRHDHDYYELVYMLDGFCLHDVGGRMTLLTEGDLFIIPPGAPHRYVGNRWVKLYNCLFLPQAAPAPVADALGTLFESGRYPRAHLSLNDRKSAGRLLSGMLDECTGQRPGWALKLAGQFSELMVDFLRLVGTGERGESPAYSKYVSRALSFVDAHYAGNLTVSDVARAADVSPDYLTRQFRMAIGITPVEYIKRYRLARAMELLSSGATVTESARRVGFLSLCHFSREFKKALGITPSEYRAQDQ